jgi:hypothetical protein
VAAGRATVVDQVRDVAGACGVHAVVCVQPEDVRACRRKPDRCTVKCVYQSQIFLIISRGA